MQGQFSVDLEQICSVASLYCLDGKDRLSAEILYDSTYQIIINLITLTLVLSLLIFTIIIPDSNLNWYISLSIKNIVNNNRHNKNWHSQHGLSVTMQDQYSLCDWTKLCRFVGASELQYLVAVWTWKLSGGSVHNVWHQEGSTCGNVRPIPEVPHTMHLAAAVLLPTSLWWYVHQLQRKQYVIILKLQLEAVANMWSTKMQKWLGQKC